MAQKNATPGSAQQASIKAAGLNAAEWVVVKELPSQLIIRKIKTDQYEIIDRRPKRLGMQNVHSDLPSSWRRSGREVLLEAHRQAQPKAAGSNPVPLSSGVWLTPPPCQKYISRSL